MQNGQCRAKAGTGGSTQQIGGRHRVLENALVACTGGSQAAAHQTGHNNAGHPDIQHDGFHYGGPGHRHGKQPLGSKAKRLTCPVYQGGQHPLQAFGHQPQELPQCKGYPIPSQKEGPPKDRQQQGGQGPQPGSAACGTILFQLFGGGGHIVALLAGYLLS